MNRRQYIAVLLFAGAALVAGCAPLQPITIPNQGEIVLGPENEMDYYDHLKDKPRVSMADGVRMLAALAGESPHGRPLADLRATLLEKDVIRRSWEITESAPLTKGKLAYMICAAAGIRTSLIMRLGIRSERYALREAVYHELLTSSSVYRYVSGTELLDALSQTQSYLRRREAQNS